MANSKLEFIVGGFSVPAHLVEEIKNMYKKGGVISRSVETQFSKGVEGTWIEGGGMRQFIKTDELENVRVNMVTSWSWDTVDICQELNEADVVLVTLFLKTADGNEHTVSEVEELLLWSHEVSESSNTINTQRDFSYYVQNLWAYHKQCKVAEARDKKDTDAL